jgi:hypothetical protein
VVEEGAVVRWLRKARALVVEEGALAPVSKPLLAHVARDVAVVSRRSWDDLLNHRSSGG